MIRAFWCSVLTALVLQAAVDGKSSTTWPKGLYGLLEPTSGCPTGWSDKGWIFHNTVDVNQSNQRSNILHMNGFVFPSDVLKYFCIKTTTNTTGSNWPKGQYCIYRRNGKTLAGMQWGTIRVYSGGYIDAYAFTYNILRVSTLLKYTDFYFYCQTSGNKKIPISLPITKPFYLLPYGSRDCQQVKWMVATSEWIKYQTNNYITKREQQTYGTVPYHELGDIDNKGITMFYCYYESCKYTLIDTKGVFQSPGFPAKYPDGQLCSWRIMVPDNHTLHVRFTNFSLDGNDMKDNLMFFKNSTLNDTLHGHREPFTIRATSDVLFEFLTNEEGNSTGFRAEYTLFKTSEMTPSPPSPPSTNRNTGQHTTTIPTTDTKNKTDNSTADNTAILIVIPLICLVVVIAVAIAILYRWRHPKEDATNPTYDDVGPIPIQQRTSTATMNTTVGTDDNDGQTYQTLSRDQQHEYEAPHYSKHNGIDDPSMDSGYPENNELETMDNNNPSGDQMYQALDKETTHNHLYQSLQPAAMVTQNPLYVDSSV